MSLIKVELMKLKKMFIIEGAILAPIIAIAAGFSSAQILMNEQNIEGWWPLWSMSSFIFGGVIIPIFVVLASIVMGKVENENNSWKQVMIMPVKKSNIYLAKLSTILIITLIMFISFLVEIQFAAMAIGAKGIIPIEYVRVALLGFIAILPVIAVEFILAKNFKSISVPLAIGMFLTGSGFLLTQSDYWKYAPWTYCNYTLFADLSNFTFESYWYIGVAIFVFLFFVIVDMYKFKFQDIE